MSFETLRDWMAKPSKARQLAVKRGWTLCKDGQRRGCNRITRRDVEELIRAFWNKVYVRGDDECWPWLSGRTGSGRPAFWIAGRQRMAYRVAFLLFRGTINPSLQVCHSCDNEICCNPHHLFQGTQLDNIRDMIAKGRKKRGEQSGIKTLKLTNAEVLAIRADNRTYVVIAKDFGIHRSTARMIKTGKTWKHLL